MTVKIIRKNQGAEVTDKMLVALIKWAQTGDAHPMQVKSARQAMEAARESEIERIEVEQEDVYMPNLLIEIHKRGLSIKDVHDCVVIENKNIIPLGEAIMELGRQLK